MPAMTPGLTIELLWPSVLRRYIGASAALHLIWEIAQQPLYTIWSAPLSSRALAVLHCTIGDLMIASLSLLAALAIVDRPDWPRLALSLAAPVHDRGRIHGLQRMVQRQRAWQLGLWASHANTSAPRYRFHPAAAMARCAELDAPHCGAPLAMENHLN